ncbi:sodium/proton-translocating pyrophosphatase [Halorussus salinus]|uniref:sodium/proton-translocating pyrophosphatase n=1 Tax=Halorussus salinus TaxID=1364935 RepID=UPI0010921169|nr:sodium/proton-translocating pyrophosphatase [Halorussus salinus]
MARSIEFSGGSLGLLVCGFQLVALSLLLVFVALPLDDTASVALAFLFGSVAVAAVVGLWRTATGDDEGTHLGTPEDITYDPFADPGQAAKDRWEKAVRRLPGEDDERD